MALHTAKDVSVTPDANEASEMEVKVAAPARQPADALAPGTSVATKETGSAEAKPGHSRIREQSASFVAPGERIIAVGYQEVRFRTFSSSTADAPQLAKTTVW